MVMMVMMISILTYVSSTADFTAAIGSSESSDGLGANPLPSHSLSELKLRCKYRRSLAYYELGRFDDVVKDCTGVIGQDPNSVQARGEIERVRDVIIIYLTPYHHPALPSLSSSSVMRHACMYVVSLKLYSAGLTRS